MLTEGVLFVTRGLNRALEVETALPGVKAVPEGGQVPRGHIIRQVFVDAEVDRRGEWWLREIERAWYVKPRIIVLEPKP